MDTRIEAALKDGYLCNTGNHWFLVNHSTREEIPLTEEQAEQIANEYKEIAETIVMWRIP